MGNGIFFSKIRLAEQFGLRTADVDERFSTQITSQPFFATTCNFWLAAKKAVPFGIQFRPVIYLSPSNKKDLKVFKMYTFR